MPQLKSARHERFAVNVAAGLSATAAYIKAGYSKNGAGQSAEKLLKNTEVQARITELSSKITEAVVVAAIAERENRVQNCDEIYRRLWSVVEERAADPKMVKIPGGKSGFIVRQVKAVGAGANQKIVLEYVVDTALSRELRATMQQVAQELGQWTEKKEVTGKDGGPLSIEVLDGWLEESEGSAVTC